MAYDGPHAELTDRIIRAAHIVANELGEGFLESVYKKSLIVALHEAGLLVEQEIPIPVTFHGVPVGNFFADLIVNKSVILELKADNIITKQAESQLINYLRCTPIEVGLLLAFGDKVRIRRLVFSNTRKPNLHKNPTPTR